MEAPGVGGGVGRGKGNKSVCGHGPHPVMDKGPLRLGGDCGAVEAVAEVDEGGGGEVGGAIGVPEE